MLSKLFSAVEGAWEGELSVPHALILGERPLGPMQGIDATEAHQGQGGTGGLGEDSGEGETEMSSVLAPSSSSVPVTIMLRQSSLCNKVVPPLSPLARQEPMVLLQQVRNCPYLYPRLPPTLWEGAFAGAHGPFRSVTGLSRLDGLGFGASLSHTGLLCQWTSSPRAV